MESNSKKLIIITSAVIIIILIALFSIRSFSGEDNWICQNGSWIRHGNPSSPEPSTPCGENKWSCQNGNWVKVGIPSEPRPTSGCGVANNPLSIEGRIVELVENKIMVSVSSGKTEELFLGSGTKIFKLDGAVTDHSYLLKGFTISAIGNQEEDIINVSEIRVTAEPNIIVFEPVAQKEVDRPLVIEGEARVFESQLNYRVKDSDGTILHEGSAMASSSDMGLYGPFKIIVDYSAPSGNVGTVEVFDYSAKDGSEIDKAVIPVKFSKQEILMVKAFFGNVEKNPGALDCAKVFAVERKIPKTTAVARAALEELLKGPDNTELKKGFFSSINPGVKISKLTIEKGIAKVDFDENMQKNVGGSCRVTTIRSQITETLKQFPTVKDVIISVNGRTEDILQP